MKSNYKPLGQYLKPVSIRNSQLQIKNLIGLSIQKKFIPSISNTIGTDMSTYRIINTNQFAYCPVTSRNGEKVTIALYEEKETAIISQAYDIFEITNAKELLSEYLMMWFRRPEFDRYARFVSHGSVREMLSWEDLCETQLPVPHPNKQKEIVKEYNTIVNRIALNNQIIKKLEETAQAIYRQWFIDFEFPFDFAQGKPNENGKPYKSNGGEMIESELGEIPKGWEVSKVGRLCDCNSSTLSPKDDFETIDYLDTSNITSNEIEEIQILNLQVDEIPSRAKRKVIHNDIIFSTVRPNLKHFGILKNINGNMIVSTGFAVLRTTYPNLCSELLYLTITKDENLQTLQALAEMRVSTYPSINPEDLQNLDFILPTKDVLEKAENIFVSIFDLLGNYQKEKKILKSFYELLLSKLATIENK